MRRLLIATTNPHKLREIRELLSDVPATLVGLDELSAVEEPEETGATFEENARAKALYYARLNRGGLTVAEDSGLVVDALDGEPGVHSARFLRPDATYPERFSEIFRRLDERPERPTARFVCAAIFFYPPYNCTLAEVAQASKLRVAHRGQAFRAFAEWLRSVELARDGAA